SAPVSDQAVGQVMTPLMGDDRIVDRAVDHHFLRSRRSNLDRSDGCSTSECLGAVVADIDDRDGAQVLITTYIRDVVGISGLEVVEQRQCAAYVAHCCEELQHVARGTWRDPGDDD